MTCDRIRAQLTPYLDGELEGDRGTLVRGHLRGCDACRQVAADEAALRDGLRALPSLDPPSTMWAGVQARLAAAEDVESRRPAWRRLVSRWAANVPSLPRLVTGGLVVAVAATAVWWKVRPTGELAAQSPVVIDVRPPKFGPDGLTPVTPVTPVTPTPLAPVLASDDVTADLAAESARTMASYATVIDEMLVHATRARTEWSVDRAAAFDERVTTLREALARAESGRPRERAARSLVRYLEGAVIRDDIALASGGVR